jgi:hypothetical protein
MHDNKAKEFGLRAIKCDGWQWACGMTTICESLIHFEQDGQIGIETGWGGVSLRSPGRMLPDFRDSATLGCLLALVRKAYGNLNICTATSNFGLKPGDISWHIPFVAHAKMGARSNWVSLYTTEIEALVAALEAAPNPNKTKV